MVDLEGLRLCFLAGTLGQGGAERQLFYVLSALRDSGAELDVLSLTRGEAWEESFRAAGFPATWVGGSPFKARRLARIIAELRERPADIVQSQHFFANLYVAAAARAVGGREVGAMRSDGISELATGRVQGRLNIRAPRLIAANSNSAIGNVVALGYPAAKFHLLPNTVDTAQFKPSTARQPGPVRLLSVGRLVRAKRFDRLLAALARVRSESCNGATGVIVGSGREIEDRGPELRRQAAELGLLADGLEFRGAVAAMPRVYGEADVLVLTSDYEGTPNVVLEAMASGLPVVSTRVGDVPGIVQDGETGYLVDPNDEDSLVEALLRLMGNESLRIEMGLRARRWVEDHRSPGQLPKLLAELYGRALA